MAQLLLLSFLFFLSPVTTFGSPRHHFSFVTTFFWIETNKGLQYHNLVRTPALPIHIYFVCALLTTFVHVNSQLTDTVHDDDLFY